MSSNRVPWPRRMRGWSVIALVACALWLVLQNSLLLVWISSPHLMPYLVVARALVRVSLHLAGQLWMLPVAVVLGVALALSSGERGAAERAREVSHG